MSFEKIYEKLLIIEKKLDTIEELKPLILNSENLCGKYINDLLYLAREEIKNKELIDANNKKYEDKIEKGQEPEKEDNWKETNMPVTSNASLIDKTNKKFNDIEMNVFTSNNPDTKKDLKNMILKLSNCNKNDSENTVLHVIQALNTKLYFDKVRNSRRNLLDHLPSLEEIKYSKETNVPLNTSGFGNCDSSVIDITEMASTTQEQFSSRSELNEDVIEATPLKKKIDFDESDEDYFNYMSASDTLNSDESGINETTLKLDADDDENGDADGDDVDEDEDDYDDEKK